jgi:hypothetical protein
MRDLDGPVSWSRRAILPVCGGFALVVATLCGAANIPSWLDDAISKFNDANPQTQIKFVDIKDQFVWYNMSKADFEHAQIRERVNGIVLKQGYEPMDDEELLTTRKPPLVAGKTGTKKCWSRSFVLNIDAQANTKAVGDDAPGQRQRMLTSLVCEDSTVWWAAFRVAG